MLKADFKQTLAEKLLLNGRILQPAASVGLCDRVEFGDKDGSNADGS